VHFWKELFYSKIDFMAFAKGKLIAIGGSEDRSKPGPAIDPYRAVHKLEYEDGILSTVLHEVKGKKTKLELITTASSIPDEVAKDYHHAFEQLGINISTMHIATKEQADSKETLRRLEACDAVMFSGGDQFKISKAFRKTKALELLTKRYQQDEFVIAGTSAGAMMMSKVMIKSGLGGRALFKGEVKIGKGLGFNSEIVIDSHFMKRGRIARIIQALAQHPTKIGVGLGEDTGVIIERGEHMRIIGSEHVIVVDMSQVTHNNFDQVDEHMPFSVDKVSMSALTRGLVYDLINKKLVNPQTQSLK